MAFFSGFFSQKTKKNEEEIKRNTSNLNNLYETIKDSTTKSSINEALEERKYLLDQKSKHLNSVIQEAKNTPLNDTDVIYLLNETYELKINVDILVTKSENLKYRNINEEN